MPQCERSAIEGLIDAVQIKVGEDWIQSLPQLEDIKGEKVAHFGCAGGRETLALMWVLDAHEVYGIDRDIFEVRQMRVELQGYISDCELSLPYLSQEDYSWWRNKVPPFIKRERFPIFIKEQDIAHPTQPFQLPGSYFDLACCSNLLYIILEEQGEEGVLSAVQEMRRVVRPGGWIVADEPDNSIATRLKPIFHQTELCHAKTQTYGQNMDDQATSYYYRKPHEN
jgi:SAM-dependent methyltransferase